MSETTLVKICGLTNLEDTLLAIDAGADFLGFNFYSQSPRYLSYEKAKRIFEEVPPNIPKVGVFVNEDFENLIDIVQLLELDYVQFHGDETPDFCNQLGHPWWKAIRLGKEEDLEEVTKYESEWILIDAHVQGQYGGTGVKPDWDLAKRVKNLGKKIFLAGGLKPDNVQLAIATVQPYAVDVASGVESKPGKKDAAKMEDFVRRAKSVHLHVV